jgi:hypothetical protein
MPRKSPLFRATANNAGVILFSVRDGAGFVDLPGCKASVLESHSFLFGISVTVHLIDLDIKCTVTEIPEIRRI